MKKAISVLLNSIILVSIFSGCNFIGNKDETVLETQKDMGDGSAAVLSEDDIEEVTIKIGWEFNNRIKVENDIEIPYTDVFLVIKGEKEEKIEIGSYIGYATEVEDFNNRYEPLNTIIACQSWYAGGGDDLCIVYKEDGSISVQWRPVYEPSGDSDDFTIEAFKEIKEMKLPDSTTILFLDNKQEKDREIALVHKKELFKLAYELHDSQKIYYSESRIILINTGENYKQLNDPNTRDEFASFPELSPDKKNIAYILPYEFELLGNVYIYNIEDETSEKVVQVDYDKSDTAKVVKWLDDDRLLVIIGLGVGTVSKGGDLYLYNRVSDKTTLIKEVEKKKEIIGFEIVDDRIILEIITWDNDCREYTTEFEDLTFENISAAE